jgi:uncharacterized protein
MQTNILWSGIEYYSLENCIIDFNRGDNIIKSTILGFYNEKIYRVEYVIKSNRSWETYYCFVEFQFNNEVRKFEYLNNKGKWSLNGKYQAEFDGCTDVDIPLMPFTNSLPINRLKLNSGQEKEVDIVYIDLLENNIRHVKQKYRKISSELYKYENIPNDFEAVIKVDTEGFVIDYPQLFTRTARVQSNYR